MFETTNQIESEIRLRHMRSGQTSRLFVKKM